MKKKKNVIKNPSETQLKHQKSDTVALLLKSALGAIPVAGSLLSEVVSTIIPNQRLDRVAKFAEKLEAKISRLEKSYLFSLLSDEEFVGILEEGIIQAAKSTSESRREYIASIIAKGISDKEVKFSETRRMLTILGDLNDSEIITLRYYLVQTIQGDEEFREKNRDIVIPPPVTLGSPQPEKDKAAILDNYREHLVSLGLLENEYDTDIRTGVMLTDNFTHGPKIRGKNLTSMGRLFLRFVGLSKGN
jgi:hypothetical protein